MPVMLKLRGLVTFRNELDKKDGALEVADNIVIDEDGVAEPRRGYSDYGDVIDPIRFTTVKTQDEFIFRTGIQATPTVRTYFYDFATDTTTQLDNATSNVALSSDGDTVTFNTLSIPFPDPVNDYFKIELEYVASDVNLKQMLNYKDRVLRHHGTELEYDDGSGNFTQFSGEYNELEAGLRIKAIETKRNLYFTTDDGVKKISAETADDFTSASDFIIPAGAPKALDLQFELDDTPEAGGILKAGPYSITMTGTKKGDELDQTYFVLSTILESTGFWYNVDGGTAPVFPAPVPDNVVEIDTINEIVVAAQTNGAAVIAAPTVLTTPTAGLFSNVEVGQFVFISGGTNVTPGTYEIITKTDNQTLVLDSNFITATSSNVAYIVRETDDDISTVAQKTAAKINSQTGFSSASTGNDIIVSNDDTGSVDSPVMGTSGYSFVEDNDGRVGEVIAYRLVWGRKDINNNTQLGSPSSRLVLQNIGDSPDIIRDSDVNIITQIPQSIGDTSYFYQLYRSQSSNADPGDELKLVAESNLTADDLDATLNPDREITIADFLSEELRSVNTNLYTNENTGEGISQANDPPPICKDLEPFRRSLFYANTSTNQLKALTLVGVANSTDDLDGKKFYISDGAATPNNVTFIFEDYDSTGATNPTGDLTPTTNYIKIGIDLTLADPGLQINIAARNMVRAINKIATNPVYAYYLSGPNDLPGEMILENRSISGPKFYIGAEAGVATFFSPKPPTYSGSGAFPTDEASSNEAAVNRLYYSKTDEPEAVPTVNTLDVGPKDKAILRVIALRDNLFVLKEEGVYLITGSSAANFSVRLLDKSAGIVAADSAAVLNNKIYCLSTQGVVTISETGVNVLSRAIENKILDVVNNRYSYQTSAFGVSYENDRSYILWLPTSTTDTQATQAYRYNTFTNTWTRWIKSNTCGIVNSGDDKLYLGVAGRNVQEQERKNRDRTDYADRNFEIGFITGTYVENTIRLDSIVDVEVGDVIYQTQYITASQVNRVLRNLDNDPILAVSAANGGAGYVNTVGLVANGSDLQSKLQLLSDTLEGDALIGTWGSTITISDNFVDMQTEFNTIVGRLNSVSVNTFYKKYILSENSTNYESVITEIDSFSRDVMLSVSAPFLYASGSLLEIYKRIPCEIVWAPEDFDGTAHQSKQVSEGTVLFDQNNFYSAEVSYASDLSPSFDEIAFFGKGFGVWGAFVWGEEHWGGHASDTPFRTLIPLEKQRCRYITCKFRHVNAREAFRLLGISLEARLISSRAYR